MTTSGNPVSAPVRPGGASAGLYNPAFEHDACGIAMVADLHGRRSHRLVRQALDALEALAHRGATGAEVATGDGAGILVQQPHRLWQAVIEAELPEAGAYASGLVFLPGDEDDAGKARQRVDDLAAEEGLRVVAWRDVPVEPSMLGASARATMPRFGQVVVTPTGPCPLVQAGRPTPWPWTGWPSASASGWSTRCRARTCRRCRPVPSSTRGC